MFSEVSKAQHIEVVFSIVSFFAKYLNMCNYIYLNLNILNLPLAEESIKHVSLI